MTDDLLAKIVEDIREIKEDIKWLKDNIEPSRQIDAAKQSNADNAIEVLRRQGEGTEKKVHRFRIPESAGTVYLIDGTQLNVPEDRIVTVSAEDAAAFGKRGWERLPD